MYKKNTKGMLKHIDFILLDILCVNIAFIISSFIKFGVKNPYSGTMQLTTVLVVMFIDIAVIACFETLKNILKRNTFKDLLITIKHVCLVTLIYTFFLFITKQGSEQSREVFFVMMAIYAVISFSTRSAWKAHIIKHVLDEGDKRSLLIVTEFASMDEVVANIKNNNYKHIHLSGIAVIDNDIEGQQVSDVQVVANKDDLLEYVCREWIDEVFICVSENEKYIQELTDKLVMAGVVVHVKLANAFATQRQIVDRLGSYTVLTTGINYATPLQAALKRFLDILGGLCGTIITGIIFIFVAPLIYKESPGPIFFAQERVGKNGRRFKMFKFRSMYLDAEERKQELMAQNRVKDGMMFKLEWDPRIIGSKVLTDGTTKKGIGNIIRELSLDEFPQFINVLKGDMSLVGTRPPTVDEWEKYDLHHRARLAAKPGITGMWQVSGRSDITDFEEVVRLDTQYITEWSPMLDIKILLKTVAVVLKRKGSM